MPLSTLNQRQGSNVLISVFGRCRRFCFNIWSLLLLLMGGEGEQLLHPGPGVLARHLLLLRHGDQLRPGHQLLELRQLQLQRLVAQLQGDDVAAGAGRGGGADLAEEEGEADLVAEHEEEREEQHQAEQQQQGQLVDEGDVVEQTREHLADSFSEPAW